MVLWFNGLIDQDNMPPGQRLHRLRRRQRRVRHRGFPRGVGCSPSTNSPQPSSRARPSPTPTPSHLMTPTPKDRMRFFGVASYYESLISAAMGVVVMGGLQWHRSKHPRRIGRLSGGGRRPAFRARGKPAYRNYEGKTAVLPVADSAKLRGGVLGERPACAAGFGRPGSSRRLTPTPETLRRWRFSRKDAQIAASELRASLAWPLSVALAPTPHETGCTRYRRPAHLGSGGACARAPLVSPRTSP